MSSQAWHLDVVFTGFKSKWAGCKEQQLAHGGLCDGQSQSLCHHCGCISVWLLLSATDGMLS